MMTLRYRAMLFAGAVTLSLAMTSTPAHAQIAVFDATNFSQNLLTAARELQQVNNEIQSLENQATMLINQAKNLASLPYSSLAQLDQSITQTQQLLSQAQNIAYDVTTIDQAFTEVYPQTYASTTSSSQLESDAQTRWENARASYQDAMNVQAGAVQNLATTHAQIDALDLLQPICRRRAPGQSGGQPDAGHPERATRRPHRSDRRPGPCPGFGRCE